MPVPESRIPGKFMIASTRSSCTLSTHCKSADLVRAHMPHAGPSLFPVSISISSEVIASYDWSCAAQLLHQPGVKETITNFYSSQGITSTNVLLTLADYGRRSQKYEERPLGNARLNFEDLTTVLSQIKAWQAVTLRKLNKWHYPSQNVTVGDIVAMRENRLIPMRWPIARVIKTIAGNDGVKSRWRRELEPTHVMCSLALLFDRQNFKHCAYVVHSLPPSLVTIQFAMTVSLL